MATTTKERICPECGYACQVITRSDGRGVVIYCNHVDGVKEGGEIVFKSEIEEENKK